MLVLVHALKAWRKNIKCYLSSARSQYFLDNWTAQVSFVILSIPVGENVPVVTKSQEIWSSIATYVAKVQMDKSFVEPK